MAFKKKFAPRRKFCRFCADKDLPLNYKRPDILRDFITERGKIIARRITGTCAHHQRLLTREIKRARPDGPCSSTQPRTTPSVQEKEHDLRGRHRN